MDLHQKEAIVIPMIHSSDDNDKNNKNEKEDDDANGSIIHFPTLAERDRIRKQQDARENEWRKNYKKHTENKEPFFNFGHIPLFTKSICATLVIIHIAMLLIFDDITRMQIIYNLGFVPEHITNINEWKWFYALTPITYMLLHSDLFHLGFNVIMTLALGTFVERMFSTKTTILFFLICGIGGAAIFLALNPTSPVPVIGASGAISGLFAAAMLIMYELGRLPLRGRLAKHGKWSIILIWSAIMLVIGLLSGGNIAWQAHLGGFWIGAILYDRMRKGKLRL